MDSPAPPLLSRWPALARTIDHLLLMPGPTAVEPAPDLARRLGIGELWIKRDDLTAPRYGGNKVRKLEFLLAHARRLGRDRVVTVGAIGSHHVLATALHGRAQGFAVDAILSPQDVNPHVQDQLRLILHHCRRCVLVSDYEARPAALAALCAPEERGGPAAYDMPAGGSTPVGALGFVSAVLELEDQVAARELPAPDRIYLPLGSCGTLAGTAVGLGLSQLSTRVVAARVTPRWMGRRGEVVRLARHTAALLRRSAPGLASRSRRWEFPSRFDVDERFYAPGYGAPRADVEEALALALEYGGLVLEGTYTGRSFASLVADARAGLLRHKSVVFWQTLSSVNLTGLVAEARAAGGVPDEFRGFLAD